MVNGNLEAQRQTIKHYWLNVTHLPKEIQELTNIPLCTIERNIKNLKKMALLSMGGKWMAYKGYTKHVSNY